MISVKKTTFFLFISCFIFGISAQEIPSNRVLKTTELPNYLVKNIQDSLGGSISNKDLAAYFRDTFSKRFFYNYKTIPERMEQYHSIYQNQKRHKENAMDHMGKYNAKTNWLLPFNYVNGSEVNAYALRHLARQHKMVDIALHYFDDQKNPKYIRYFKNQMLSLNTALEGNAFEKIENGNGVYEVFRSGYRILNWLKIHNLFLNETEYSDEDQLITIATLLQHAQHLYEHNATFNAGNHQTRGMSALALVAILFPNFKEANQWYNRAMERLGEHLDKEINADGFQFERSIHYHMSDIKNYFYVYQLAKISDVKIDEAWENKLRSLFTTLAKVAYPDKSAPVLQDDTNIPWAEKNDISGAMTLGYILFQDPELGYFATDKIEASMYWYLQQSQLDNLKRIKTKKPTIGSTHFADTKYYITREGWDKNDKIMVISAGVDKEKPDHQHGDILGIQAMANGQVILPNYQVRYSLKDFDLFKNSLVKNVAVVDNELQGKQWTSNKGGSGFGKFKELPSPQTLVWENNPNFDLFIGSHDGFNNIDVNYKRHVLYLKNDFWIVKDVFSSNTTHSYKQIWQGHYTDETGPNLIRSTFPNASGCDILQLKPIDSTFNSGARGKNWTIASKENQSNFNFITVIFPYKGYSNRIAEDSKTISLKGWTVNSSNWNIEEKEAVSLTKGNAEYLFNVQHLNYNKYHIEVSEITDLFVELRKGKILITNISSLPVTIKVLQHKKKKPLLYKENLKPGIITAIDIE